MSNDLTTRLRQAAQYTGLDSMRELLIEAAGALEVRHASDCAVHNEPAYPAGECDCNAEEDDFVIKRMSELLASIAIIVKGPEPALRRWSYHDLPELVAAAITAAPQPQERKRITDEQMEAVHEAARRSFIRHKSSIGGQQLTAADSFETHVMLATWAECCKTHGIKD